MKSENSTKHFTMVIEGSADGQSITNVTFDFDHEQGLSAANLLGLTVQEFLLDHPTVEAYMERATQKLVASVEKNTAKESGQIH